MDGNTLHEGHYRTRLRKGAPWLPVMVRVENSRDEDGRVADRPRLVLYLGGERHERPSPSDWTHRLWPISEAEHRRLSGAHDANTVASHFNLKTAPSLF